MNTNPVKILLGAALLGLSPILFAQDLILNGQTIALDPNEDVSINPVTGDITVFAADPDLSCSSSGPLPNITSFDVDPTTVQQGGSVNISWASVDATSCVGQGNLPGWGGTSRPVNGSVNVPIAAGQAPGNYTAGLRCSNAEGQDQVNPVTVTVESAGGGTCSSRPPPSGMSRDTTLLLHSPGAQTISWAQVFGGGQDFPAVSGSSPTMSIPNGHYGVLAFSTSALQIGGSGRLVFDEVLLPSSHRLAPPLVVISDCPGDFGPTVDARCRQIPGLGSNNFRWAESSIVGSTSTRCPIERNEDLYLNLVPAETIPSGQNVTWRCDGSGSVLHCGWLNTAMQ